MNDCVRQVAAEILMLWRHTSLSQLQGVAARYSPGFDVDLEELADMLPALIDGSIIFSRVVADHSVLPNQIRLYRTVIASIFRPELP